MEVSNLCFSLSNALFYGWLDINFSSFKQAFSPFDFQGLLLDTEIKCH